MEPPLRETKKEAVPTRFEQANRRGSGIRVGQNRNLMTTGEAGGGVFPTNVSGAAGLLCLHHSVSVLARGVWQTPLVGPYCLPRLVHVVVASINRSATAATLLLCFSRAVSASI